MRRPIGTFLQCCTFALVCCHAPPRPAPPPPPAPPPAQPKPPPSCDTLEDHCVGGADTRLRIQDSGWSLAPPAGWTYAHQPSVLLAVATNAALAVTTYEAHDRKSEAADRDASLEGALRAISVTPPKKVKVFGRGRPDQVEKVGNLKISLYQIDGATREEKPGAMLVFATKLSHARGLVGAGFVAESDTADSDKAILSAVKSIVPQPTETPDGGAANVGHVDSAAGHAGHDDAGAGHAGHDDAGAGHAGHDGGAP